MYVWTLTYVPRGSSALHGIFATANAAIAHLNKVRPDAKEVFVDSPDYIYMVAGEPAHYQISKHKVHE